MGSDDGVLAPDDGAFHLVVQRWMRVSFDLFGSLKRLFDLPATWTFDIKTPDLDETTRGQLHESQGAAAFMLRRIQAMRHLIAEGTLDTPALKLLLAYSNDLNQYLNTLSETHNMAPHVYEDVKTAAKPTRDLTRETALKLHHHMQREQGH